MQVRRWDELSFEMKLNFTVRVIGRGHHPDDSRIGELLREWPFGDYAGMPVADLAELAPLLSQGPDPTVAEKRRFLNYVADRISGKIKRPRGRSAPDNPWRRWRNEVPAVNSVHLLQAFYRLAGKRKKKDAPGSGPGDAAVALYAKVFRRKPEALKTTIKRVKAALPDYVTSVAEFKADLERLPSSSRRSYVSEFTGIPEDAI